MGLGQAIGLSNRPHPIFSPHLLTLDTLATDGLALLVILLPSEEEEPGLRSLSPFI
jgi:hypothetical protein